MTNPRIETADEQRAEEAWADRFAAGMTETERITFRAGWLARGAWEHERGRRGSDRESENFLTRE